MSSSGENAKVVYWHRELPPFDADATQEHVIEATSDRVPGVIERHGELWQRCYATLTENTRIRLEQEVTRLGGHYAHVTEEHIEIKQDDAKGESWLHGQFNYTLYRRTGSSI
jgi:hypothetical protein